VWLSRMIPLVPHGRENWPVAVSFLFSGRAQQLDCCRVSYDSRNEMVARLLGDLPRRFNFLVVANVQVLHHILAMGRLPIEPPFPKSKKFRWVTKSRSTKTYTQQSAEHDGESTMTRMGWCVQFGAVSFLDGRGNKIWNEYVSGREERGDVSVVFPELYLLRKFINQIFLAFFNALLEIVIHSSSSTALCQFAVVTEDATCAHKNIKRYLSCMDHSLGI
jgi:hypothetical protein